MIMLKSTQQHTMQRADSSGGTPTVPSRFAYEAEVAALPNNSLAEAAE